ncbi:MAG: DUF4956 domain-containing protein [Comamonas sp.]|nr:DUF4956 domain-containing protein [Comamonas sp.]
MNEALPPTLAQFGQVSATAASLVAISFALRLAVVASGQTWLRTYAHTITMLLLPLITYTITSVIAGNIALSLGMVGALSIVRFRNPVKSPYELALYFLLITLGVAASVSQAWMWFLACSAFVLLLLVHSVSAAYQRLFQRELFSASFTEGNPLHILEVSSPTPIAELAAHPQLIALVLEPAQQHCHYRLAHHRAQPLLQLLHSLQIQHPQARVSYQAA